MKAWFCYTGRNYVTDYWELVHPYIVSGLRVSTLRPECPAPLLVLPLTSCSRRFSYITNHPKTLWLKTTTISFCSQILCVRDFWKFSVILLLLGALTKITQWFSAGSGAGLQGVRRFHSHIWYWTWNDSKARVANQSDNTWPLCVTCLFSAWQPRVISTHDTWRFRAPSTSVSVIKAEAPLPYVFEMLKPSHVTSAILLGRESSH